MAPMIFTSSLASLSLCSLSPSPCADAMSRARALRDSPRCVSFSLVRGLRLGWSPIRCRASASILRSEPRFPSPRTLRGSRPPRRMWVLSFLHPPISVSGSSPKKPSTPLPHPTKAALCAPWRGLPMSCGLRPLPSSPTLTLSSLPDGVALSEPRSVRADGIPGRSEPGAEEPSTPLGRAAEHARSAAARQPGPPTASPPPLLSPYRLWVVVDHRLL